VNSDGEKGIYLIVDDHWPDIERSTCILPAAPLNKVFRAITNTKVPRDGKLVIALIASDQSPTSVNFSM